eukprot:1157207-Pelagomonas_calceolata.AAC.6
MGILIASGNKGKRHTSHSPTSTAVLLQGRGTVSFTPRQIRHASRNWLPLRDTCAGSMQTVADFRPQEEMGEHVLDNSGLGHT